MKTLAVFISLVAALGCQSSIDDAFGSPVGNYSLISVDGSPVPFKSGTNVTVRGTVNLKSGGDYTLTQADSSTSGTVTNTSVSGKWSLTDNALSLLPGNGTIDLGIVTIDTIRLGHASHQNVYVRQ
jgi:hypothetical protein